MDFLRWVLWGIPILLGVWIVGGLILICGACFFGRMVFRRHFRGLPDRLGEQGRRIDWSDLTRDPMPSGTLLIDCVSSGWPDYVAWFTPRDIAEELVSAGMKAPPIEETWKDREAIQSMVDVGWWCKQSLFENPNGGCSIIAVDIGRSGKARLKAAAEKAQALNSAIRILETNSGLGVLFQGQRIPES